jgi:hypothetical protein
VRDTCSYSMPVACLASHVYVGSQFLEEANHHVLFLSVLRKVPITGIGIGAPNLSQEGRSGAVAKDAPPHVILHGAARIRRVGAARREKTRLLWFCPQCPTLQTWHTFSGWRNADHRPSSPAPAAFSFVNSALYRYHSCPSPNQCAYRPVTSVPRQAVSRPLNGSDGHVRRAPSRRPRRLAHPSSDDAVERTQAAAANLQSAACPGEGASPGILAK